MNRILLVGGLCLLGACPAKDQAAKSGGSGAAAPAVAPAAAPTAAPSGAPPSGAPPAAAADPFAAKLAHAESEEAAGHAKEAAQDYSELLVDAKAPEAVDTRSRLALVKLWLTHAQQAQPPCLPAKPKKGELTPLPPELTERDVASEHLACVRKRGGAAEEAERLQSRLDALWTRDAAACRAQKLKAFAKDEQAGTLVGTQTAAQDSGPCRKAQGPDRLALRLGVAPAAATDEAKGTGTIGFGSMDKLELGKKPAPGTATK